MGFRLAGVCHVFRWDAESPQRPHKLHPRLDLWNHSPTGFEWGFSGSGPAQLALALAADALTDDERAVRVHQGLKRLLQTHLHRDCWSLTRDTVCGLICHAEEERERRAQAAQSKNTEQEGGTV